MMAFAETHFVHRRFEMLLPNFLLRIWSCFGGSGGSRIQHSILDISATDRVALGKPAEIDVCSQRSLRRMYLQLPDSRPLFGAGHLKKHMRSDSPLECRIEVCRQIRCKYHDAVE